MSGSYFCTNARFGDLDTGPLNEVPRSADGGQTWAAALRGGQPAQRVEGR